MSNSNSQTFPHILALRNDDKSQPVGALLTHQLEERFARLQDAIITGQLAFQLLPSPNTSIRVSLATGDKESGTRPATASGWPVLCLETVFPLPLKKCVKIFQDVEVQKLRSVNRRVKQITTLDELVRDGDIVDDQLQAAMSLPNQPMLPPAWYTQYKSIAYVYTKVDSFSEALCLPQIDSVDLMVVRPSVAVSNEWLMIGMSMHHESHKRVKGVRRLQNFITFTHFKSVPSTDDPTKMHCHVTSRSCIDTIPETTFPAFLKMRIEEECLRLEAMKRVQV